ncbi:MAG: tRNA 2-thiouridine(34) synthase MnmA [Bacilli bacterium]|jgi:tRNA-specific 2-thiouridylase|nr:tRNA 2-thiouridine(34) synthase MnmA [Bacilli bacterium]
MKVLLGLSGGVDSAIAAYLLKKQGYEVTGAFMRNWDAMLNNDYLGNPTVNDSQCPQEKDYQDAKQVAEQLGIPLLRVDFVKEYWDEVFSYFLAEYKKGRTPNPDVLCNKYIKFDSFLKYAKEHGFDCIAMGHYAKKGTYDGHEYLFKPLDLAKDQTYFLCQINEDQIKSCLFPMENITKVEARQIAKELGLDEVASKHGSTGVCFIGERNFRQFLHNYFPATKGKIIDISNGKVLGEHMGVLYYTLGQRKGLGIGGVSGEEDNAWFVCKKDVPNNILYVTNGNEDEHLLSDSCLVSDVNWIGDKPENEIKVGVKFRYRQPDQPCYLSFKDNEVVLRYEKPYKAVTPGQFAVFYLDGRMLGGGIIDKTYYLGSRNDI